MPCFLEITFRSQGKDSRFNGLETSNDALPGNNLTNSLLVLFSIMKIKGTTSITDKEGYEAMLYTLYDYWKLTGSRDLTDILSGGEYVEEDTPADSAFWEYWQESIEKVRREGPPPFKVLR